jgi:hypothetical protein
MQQQSLRVVAVTKGEPSVALLLLWEADHGQLYPSQAAGMWGRMVAFTKRLQKAVTADAELAARLSYREQYLTLVPGLLSRGTCWSVAIDHARVGAAFLRAWKAYLASLVVAARRGRTPPRKRRKLELQARDRGTKRASLVDEPSRRYPKKARVECPTAHAAADSAASSSSSSTSSPPCGGLVGLLDRSGCGRAYLGPPT